LLVGSTLPAISRRKPLDASGEQAARLGRRMGGACRNRIIT
jgi:hypothetical protein